MPTATGHLPIGSSSRRVPQACTAVPRTGNVPERTWKRHLREAGLVGAGDKHTEEEKTHAWRGDPGLESNSTRPAPEVAPVTQSQEWFRGQGLRTLSRCTRASLPTTALFIKPQVPLLRGVAIRAGGCVASSERLLGEEAPRGRPRGMRTEDKEWAGRSSAWPEALGTLSALAST